MGSFCCALTICCKLEIYSNHILQVGGELGAATPDSWNSGSHILTEMAAEETQLKFSCSAFSTLVYHVGYLCM